jgi:hypothetical protein
MTGGARRCVGAALTAGALLLAGCVAPAFDSGAYRVDARAALASAQSEARTAAVAAEALLDERVTEAYANTVVTESEDALGPIEDSFGVVDPPSTTDDELRESTTALLSDTADALATARIAVRRGDAGATRSAVAELTLLGDRLEKASEALS